ncbi:DUF429 domain-containing protein [Acidianus sulfidivorans JP7]|uniref:DUF429 domain-containing protein n=2 Tax=Acidianus TaxID=12914 RepID=A0A2U9IN01_9CREN|nr:DUF429 domain-containing protein [Acidianus sulfidivorans JP7]
MYCGIDLAVKRKTAVSRIINEKVEFEFLSTDEEIIEYCKGSKVVAIDSPLSISKGFRNVDRKMLKNGYKVLPPSFMISLVRRAIKLKENFNYVIETHPTSSLKKLNINWRTFSNIKDEVDAVICALTAYAHDLGIAEEILADDGAIYLLPKNIEIRKDKNNNFYYFRFLKEY